MVAEEHHGHGHEGHESHDHYRSHGAHSDPVPQWLPGLALSSGFFFMMALDALSASPHQSCGGGTPATTTTTTAAATKEAGGAAAASPAAATAPPTSGAAASGALRALIVHAAADGLAVGASCAATTSAKGSGAQALAWSVAASMALHKAPAAFGLSATLASAQWGHRRQPEPEHLVRLSLAQHRHVDGHDEVIVSGALGPARQGLAEGSVLGDVELEEQRRRRRKRKEEEERRKRRREEKEEEEEEGGGGGGRALNPLLTSSSGVVPIVLTTISSPAALAALAIAISPSRCASFIIAIGATRMGAERGSSLLKEESVPPREKKQSAALVSTRETSTRTLGRIRQHLQEARFSASVVSSSAPLA